MKRFIALLSAVGVTVAGLVGAAPSSAVGSANPTFTFTNYQATVGVSFWAQIPPVFNNLNGPTPTFASGGLATLNTAVCDALPAGLSFPESGLEWDSAGQLPTYNISGTPAVGSEGVYHICFDTQTDEGSGLTPIGTSEVVTITVGTTVPEDTPTDYTIDCQAAPSSPFDGSGSLLVELDGAQEYTKTVRIKGCAYNDTSNSNGSNWGAFVGPGTNVVYTIVIPMETYSTVSGYNPSWVSPANRSYNLQINNFAPPPPPGPSNFNEENPDCGEGYETYDLSGENMRFTAICDLSGKINDVELLDGSKDDGFDGFGSLKGYNPVEGDDTVAGDAFNIRATRIISNENGVLEWIAEDVFSVASQSRVDIYLTLTIIENTATWSFEVFETGTNTPAVMDLFLDGGLGSDEDTTWSSTNSSSMYSSDGYDEDPILIWKTDGEFVDLYQGDDSLRSEWTNSTSGSLSVIVAGYECGTTAELDAFAQDILDDFEAKKNTVIPIFTPAECPGATTFDLTASAVSISEGEDVTFSSADAPEDALSALFIDGEFFASGAYVTTPAFGWDEFGDCDTERVMTYRIYDETTSLDDSRYVSFDENYAASISVTLNAGCEVVIEHALDLLADIGDVAEGSEAEYSAVGLQEGSVWTLTLRSNPQVLATGTVPAGGEIGGFVEIPPGLEAGWHSITLSGTDLNGEGINDIVWFEIDSDGIILTISEQEPMVALAATGANASELALGFAGGIATMLAGYLLVAARRRKAII